MSTKPHEGSHMAESTAVVRGSGSGLLDVDPVLSAQMFLRAPETLRRRHAPIKRRNNISTNIDTSSHNRPGRRDGDRNDVSDDDDDELRQLRYELKRTDRMRAASAKLRRRGWVARAYAAHPEIRDLRLRYDPVARAAHFGAVFCYSALRSPGEDAAAAAAALAVVANKKKKGSLKGSGQDTSSAAEDTTGSLLLRAHAAPGAGLARPDILRLVFEYLTEVGLHRSAAKVRDEAARKWRTLKPLLHLLGREEQVLALSPQQQQQQHSLSSSAQISSAHRDQAGDASQHPGDSNSEDLTVMDGDLVGVAGASSKDLLSQMQGSSNAAAPRLLSLLNIAVREADRAFDLTMADRWISPRAAEAQLHEHLFDLGLLDADPLGAGANQNLWDELAAAGMTNIVLASRKEDSANGTQAAVPAWSSLPPPDTSLSSRLKSASLNRIIAQLTSEGRDHSPELQRVFLLTYPTFTNADTLMRKLFERFDVPTGVSADLDGKTAMPDSAAATSKAHPAVQAAAQRLASGEAMSDDPDSRTVARAAAPVSEAMIATVARTVKLRVVNVLKRWISSEAHFEDFTDQRLDVLRTFVENAQSNKHTKHLANQIETALQKQLRARLQAQEEDAASIALSRSMTQITRTTSSRTTRRFVRARARGALGRSGTPIQPGVGGSEVQDGKDGALTSVYDGELLLQLSHSLQAALSFDSLPPEPRVDVKNIFSPRLSLLHTKTITTGHHMQYNVDECEIARQMTLLEFALFARLRPSAELLHQSWMRPKLRHRAPHVLAISARSTVLSSWVSSQIVNTTKLRARARLISKFVRVAEQLRKLGNFSSLMAILAGLTGSAMHRMKFSWDEVPKNIVATLETLLRETSSAKNSESYRKTYASCRPPRVPYLGVFLTDLTFIDEGNQTFVPNPHTSVEGVEPSSDELLVNWSKARLLASVLTEIHEAQQSPYNLQPVYQIQALLQTDKLRAECLDEAQLWELSLQREPRGATKDELE